VNVSLYVHVPVCTRRCDYCDFFTRAGVAPAIQAALITRTREQWERYRRIYLVKRPISVYVGGGTPSALHGNARENLLSLIRSLRELPKGDVAGDPAPEITVEVNPEDADRTFLAALEDNGVTRLSLGVQSLDRDTLAAIGRHTALEDTRRGLETIAHTWNHPWNADIIVAIPDQTPTRARRDVTGILAYDPDHVSLYELEIVPSTVLGHAVRRDRLRQLPEENAERILFECGDLLENHGYEQYEVSAFARPRFRSVHNLRYWRMEPYIGIGPGAVGTMPAEDGAGLPQRFEGTRDFQVFRNDGDFGVRRENIGTPEFCREHIMMAFRTIDGLDSTRFRQVFGYDVERAIPKTLDSWSSFLLRSDRRLALNRGGLRLTNAFVRDAFIELDANPPPRERPQWPV